MEDGALRPAGPAGKRSRSSAPATQLTPLAWLWITVAAASLFVVLQTWLALQVPTLGLVLETGEPGPGLRVSIVYEGMPADSAGVREGDVVEAVSSATTEHRLTLEDHVLLLDPDIGGTYAIHNAVHRDARTLTHMLASGPVTLHLRGGRSVQVEARPSRPLWSLPFWYWAISSMGIVALAIGAGLKAHTRGSSDTSLVLLAAVGFWMTAWSWPIYGPRELAVAMPEWLMALEAANHLGFVLLTAAALALLWQYPTRLGPGSALWITLGTGLVIWLAITAQWFEFPGHAFYVPLFCLPLLPGIALAALQMRASRHRAIEKASLRWLLITLLGSTCGAFALYAVPPIFGSQPLAPPWLSQFVLLIFFLGLALGAARYRLFDMERWWLQTWLWFAMGAAIVAVDAALISVLHMGAASSTVLAVLIVAWVYFPVRQWVWQRLARAPERSPWQIMPEVARRFTRPLRPGEIATELAELLQLHFDASDSLVLESDTDAPRLTRHGLSLSVPLPDGEGQVVITGKESGRRLFDRRDQQFVTTLLTVVRRLVHLADERAETERRERDRIMRDLHDDVGARLLSLIHGASDSSVRAEALATLETLRTSVYPLHARGSTPLPRATADWKSEFHRRTAESGAALSWSDRTDAECTLNPRQYVNVTRILRELLTNALKHASPQHVEVVVETTGVLTVVLRHDGCVSDPDGWSANAGLHNLATRASEIDAHLDFELEHSRNDGGEHIRATLTVPL